MKPSTPATIDPSGLRTSLSPLLPILDAFNHRHKNQHRSSHWWSHFSILRRSVKALFSCPSRQDVLLPRVRWLKDCIVPRVYVPFTQLAADNQYAPLGLLLVGLLARISTVLVEALPEEPDSEPTAVLETPTATSPLERETDKGTTISRGEFARPKAVTDHDTRKASDSAAKRPAEDHEPLISTKKKKATDGGEAAAPLKKKKKKSKTKGDDAFSSMFGSL